MKGTEVHLPSSGTPQPGLSRGYIDAAVLHKLMLNVCGAVRILKKCKVDLLSSCTSALSFCILSVIVLWCEFRKGTTFWLHECRNHEAPSCIVSRAQ